MDSTALDPVLQRESWDEPTYAEALQDHAAAPLLCPEIYHAQNYTFCDWATTVTGYDVNTGKYIAIGVTCKRWGCPFCAVKKIRRLAWMSRNAEPNRLLTLTVSSKRYASGEDAWKGTSKAFPELVRYIRKNRGECEYLRVLELQANGMPHFHCMLRSPFIPQRELVAEWRRIIGFPETPYEQSDKPKEWAGVNLKRIDDSFRTFRYLVKYLTKLHKIPWTDRHVSYSRGFFKPEDLEQVEYAKLENVEKYDVHPWQYLNERYYSTELKVLDHGKWELPAEPLSKQYEINPEALGLPPAHPVEPAVPLKQRLVPGLSEDDIRREDDNLRADGRKKARTRRKSPAQPARPQASNFVPLPKPKPAPDDDF